VFIKKLISFLPILRRPYYFFHIKMLDQITAFEKSATKGRGNNDANNKSREEVIKGLISGSIPAEFFADPEYGSKWTDLRTALFAKLPELYSGPYSRLEIVQRAGRNYNYDFYMTYFDGLNTQIHDVKLEFKFGAKSIGQIPQFYQKNTNWEIIKDAERGVIGYHEYFYDNHLDEILQIARVEFPDISSVEKMGRDIYVKLVMRTDHECHPFFGYLRNTECSKQKAVVKKSIAEFLKTYGNNVDLAAFATTIQATQESKKYLLYDPVTRAFYVESVDLMNGTLVYNGVKRGNSIVITTEKYVFGLLLRWKNHQGVLNPAWQVSVHPNKK